MVHSEDQGEMLEHDQVAGEQRDAGIQVEEVNPEDNIVKTAGEGQQERLEVHFNYELGMNAQNESKTLFRILDNPVIGEGVEDQNEMTSEEVAEVKYIIRHESLNDIAVKDELKPDVVSPTNIVEEAALVPKTIEYIVDCDSE